MRSFRIKPKNPFLLRKLTPQMHLFSMKRQQRKQNEQSGPSHGETELPLPFGWVLLSLRTQTLGTDVFSKAEDCSASVSSPQLYTSPLLNVNSWMERLEQVASKGSAFLRLFLALNILLLRNLIGIHPFFQAWIMLLSSASSAPAGLKMR